LRFGFGDDREDLDFRFCNVIKHPDVAYSETVLGLAQAPESFDSALADFGRLVLQVPLERLFDTGSNGHGQVLERGDGLRSQDDLEGHSGQIIARFLNLANRVDCCI
jgi:hypothetical protein